MKPVFGIKKLRHINFRDLTKLSRKYLVLEIPKLSKQENPICSGCQLGKQTSESHKKLTDIRATGPNPYGSSWTNKNREPWWKKVLYSHGG